MIPMNPFVSGALALVGGIRAAIFLGLALLLLASSSYWQHAAHKAQAALAVSETARAAAIGIWKGEIQRLTRDLADAKSAGAKAVSERIQAEKDAAKKLAATNKRWADRYAHDPVAKKWRDEPLPSGVIGGLQVRP